MAKKEKKISINKWESIMADPVVTVPLNGTEDVEVTIHRTLPLEDMLQFVSDAVTACVDAETGTYTPEVLPFVVRLNVLTMYANFNMPASVEKQYDMVYATDAFEQVMQHINQKQYNDILIAINKRIEHECAVMTSAVIAKVNELAKQMEDFSDATQALFSGVSGDDVSALMRNLSSIGNVDERALAHAVFEEQKSRGEIASDAGTESTAHAPDGTGEKILAFPHDE